MRRIRYALTAAAAAAAFTFVPAALDAQTLGVKLGASFANLDYADIEGGTSGITGFAGGGFLRFGTGRFGVQGELLSVTKGADIDDGLTSGEVRLEYVEIPLLIHVPLTLNTGFAPYVFAGPTISLEVSCESTGFTSFGCDDEGHKSTDFGATAGAGLAFPVGPGSILVEGRYVWGFTNLNDTGSGTEVRNRAAYVMAGYAIPLVR